MSKEDSTGTWSMDRLRIDSEDGRGTGLVNGFGNLTSEVWLLVWYNSLVDDCDFDFANCEFFLGETTQQVVFPSVLARSLDPAELTIESVEGFDRDGDLLDDSVEIGIGVSSSAFFETLSVELSAFTENSLYDSSEFTISVGNSEPEIRSVWFTPPFTAEWTITARASDITGELQDIAQTLPIEIFNMKPREFGFYFV